MVSAGSGVGRQFRFLPMTFPVAPRLSILLLAMLVAAPVSVPGALAQLAPRATPNADRLADQMRVLARNPDDLDALAEAGELSVLLGDPAAALGFFSRGDAIAPGNARLIAGRAAALTALERPGEALRLFQAAERAGYPLARMAAQRGLAYDLLGYPALAQRDYRLALRERADPEVTRRLALSLGISGDVAESARLLDPLLRQNDRAAWRARAFVLAINGDVAQAERIAAGLLPGFGPSMSPFFGRLASLDASGRAFAVHFGELTASPARLADAAMAPPIPGIEPADTRRAARETGTEVAEARSRRPRAVDPRRTRRDAGAVPEEAAPELPTRPRASSALTAAAPSAKGSIAGTLQRRGSATVARAPVPARVAPPFTVRVGTPAPNEATSVPAAAPAQVAVAQVATDVPSAPAAGPAPVEIASRPLAAVAAPVPAARDAAPPPPPATAAGAGAAAISADNRAILGAIVQRLTDGAATATTVADPSPAAPKASGPTAASRPAIARPRTPPVKPAPAKPDPAKLEPARHWVQVAGGANKSDLPKVWEKLAKTAPDLFKGKQGWTTPLRATNRLLAGPFRTASEAQAFVNQLGKSGLSAFAWQSEAGQKIERLRAR
ncbi:SPOR domain-containing protein [Sphingomonas sp. SFZ2018-12]|nr:SPOR domain-containing protein [Sphingomonas sp. SFZ2018-12]